ncbi:helix-turn-helix transcriptional regulator [Microbacterium sp. H6]|uniref:helix-turn-helix domain-containing protein n=1 Tax=Microbacterium sp. H6 TaxID=421122 RepID=UPI000DE319AF|nr:helix-turn-helix transcriptional regulator [Microbacterium sp. H6]RBO73485.1 hypothetical protein DSP71_04840 [Microbacterium sp. H6]
MTAPAVIELPETQGQSRLHRPAKSENPDDITSAADRIDAFWEKHPNGSILTEVETTVVEAVDVLPYLVFTVRAYVRKHTEDDRPSATAHATRGQNDDDELVRQFPQETAETAAISRAIRNIGILTSTTRPSQAPNAPAAPGVLPPVNALAVARKAKGWSQKTLATAMTQRGFAWSQAVVSKVENGYRPLQDDEAEALRGLVDYLGAS